MKYFLIEAKQLLWNPKLSLPSLAGNRNTLLVCGPFVPVISEHTFCIDAIAVLYEKEVATNHDPSPTFSGLTMDNRTISLVLIEVGFNLITERLDKAGRRKK